MLCRQERMAGGGGLSRSSSAKSMSDAGSGASPRGQMQVVELEDVLEGPPLKRLDFVRAQGGFWLTWVRVILAGPLGPVRMGGGGSLWAAPCKVVWLKASALQGLRS